MALHRGYDDASRSFISQAKPQVAVRAAEGFGLLRSGHTFCTVPYDDSLIGGYSAETWYSLSGREDAHLAVVFAECGGNWVWSLGGHGQEYHAYRLVYENIGAEAGSEDVRVYIRPLSRDPWLAGDAEASRGWGNGVLAARFDRLANAERNKLIIEYREPLPVRADEFLPTRDEVFAFLERARAAYEEGLPGSGAPSLRRSGRPAPSDRLIGAVIGPVEPASKIIDLD